MRRSTLAALFATAASVAHAQMSDMDAMTMANDLGTILASEEFCGLSYAQQAVSAWIDDNVDPANMAFASDLNMMTDAMRYQLEGMSESAKTAHCRSVERTARHYGFIE